MTTPAFGLLLDVDGPISNPDAKAVVQPTIVPSLLRLLHSGVPVVLNTGRSAEFVQEKVFALLGDAAPNGLLHAVCEKGAVLMAPGAPVEWDPTVTVPDELSNAVRQLIEGKYAATTFFDDTKLAMISTERRPDVGHAAYEAAQAQLVQELTALVRGLGFTVATTGEPEEGMQFRIDPTIIATDVEDARLSKALGAQRAVGLLVDAGIKPEQWRTVGDSGTDYAMAQWLHDHGHRVKHIDVGSPQSRRPTSFEVVTSSHLKLDVAGARYLAWLADHLDGNETAEDRFDLL